MRLAIFSKHQERGDTIIEVLFAVTIFAMVAVGSMTIMNQGTAAAQRALEITLVRQQIDAQAEAIRYIHQAYVAAYQQGSTPTGTTANEWVKMTNRTNGKGADNASAFGQTAGVTCPESTPGQKPFIVNARRGLMANVTPAMQAPPGTSLPPYAQVVYNNDSSINASYGLWVEAVPADDTGDGPGYVDFHIRACWESAGTSAPATLGTIVRLYEP